MLYLDQVVDVPERGVTLVKREHFIYVKQYADSWKNTDGTRNTNRRQPIVGRLMQNSTECTHMYPNETYYQLRDLPQPPRNHSRLGTPGRKCNVDYEAGSAMYPGFAMLCAFALADCRAYEFLIKHFGQILGEQIMFMATHYAAGHSSLECLEHHSFHHNIFANARGMTKQSGSELLAHGIPNECIRNFFTDWICTAAGDDPIAYDVTALPTCAQEMVLAERGYAHGGPELPQINYALMVNSRTGMPIFFSHYNGSITDKANLQYVLDRATDRNLPGTLTMIFDRGFASLKNICGLQEKGLHFIMGVPSTFTGAMARLDEFNKEKEIPFDDTMLEIRADGTYAEDITVGRTEDFTWKGQNLRLHLYRNQSSQLRKNARLHNNIQICLDHIKAAGTLPEGGEFAEAAACFKKVGKGRGTKLVLDEELYQKKQRSHGSFALFSSPECSYSTRDALYLFRSREIDEAVFNCLKTDLNSLPLRVWNDTSLDGKFFVLFVSAIIRRQLLAKLRDILRLEHVSFNKLPETLEARKFELRGDGTIAPTSTESTFESSVFARMCGPEIAKELGLKDYYVIKPKCRTNRKNK